MTNSARVGAHFDSYWDAYSQAVENNLLYHSEMFAALAAFLKTNFSHTPFTFADIGCGDASAVLNSLSTVPVVRYIGVDAAADILKTAPITLKSLPCEKEFICDNMVNAISILLKPVHVIFCSYSLHHLSFEDKVAFIKNCHEKLENNGFLILIDGVLAETQSRIEWLQALENRYLEVNNYPKDEAAAAFKRHIENDDHPESIATYREIAKQQGWSVFDVLIDKNIFAFMVFGK